MTGSGAAWVGRSLTDPGLAGRLTALGFTAADRDDALWCADAVHGSRAQQQAVATAVGRLRARVGEVGSPAGVDLWADLDPGPAPGAVALLSLVLSAPDAAAFHTARGVPSEVSAATLADVGRQVAVHRLTYGSFGLHTQDWLGLVWSGALYDLGRLQLALQREDRPGRSGWVLGAHIPRSGPLTPDGVDAALTAAGPFFATHFPDHPVSAVLCESWLLDPALSEALPTSNLAAFQRRWVPYGQPRPGDADVVFFVFSRRGDVVRDDLPTDTALRRAVLERWRRGESWSLVSGRLEHWPC